MPGTIDRALEPVGESAELPATPVASAWILSGATTAVLPYETTVAVSNTFRRCFQVLSVAPQI